MDMHIIIMHLGVGYPRIDLSWNFIYQSSVIVVEYGMNKYGGIQIDDAHKDYYINQVHIYIQHTKYYDYLDNLR